MLIGNGDPDLERYYSRGPINTRLIPVEIADQIIASLIDGDNNKTDYQEGVLSTLKACPLHFEASYRRRGPRIHISLKIQVFNPSENASKLTNRNIHYIQTAVKSPTSWRDEMTSLHALKVALGDSEWSWPQGSTKSGVVYCDSQGPWQDIGDTVELATSTWTTPIDAT
ncbi:hypothetical protein PLEOSDRAFT_1081836 [Pleurotus ostreatus PC15]|uniref:Uncharacterized protein n=1 Tax=Pleurotus ostreatus (strain PC15) TaxID=1137138 RepID=A0A067P3B2_PLEO1|nr:hypothetical protein PLEOSDRAFT_1081836 [Pleurotus ostreatus PC15]